VVPAEEAKIAPSTRLVLADPGRQGWPRIPEAATPQAFAPSPATFGWPDLFTAVATEPLDDAASIAEAGWPFPVATQHRTAAGALPVPSPDSFSLPQMFGPNLQLPLPAAGEPVISAEATATWHASDPGVTR